MALSFVFWKRAGSFLFKVPLALGTIFGPGFGAAWLALGGATRLAIVDRTWLAFGLGAGACSLDGLAVEDRTWLAFDGKAIGAGACELAGKEFEERPLEDDADTDESQEESEADE